MKHLTVKEKEVQAFEKMKISFHYKNAMAASRMRLYWNVWQKFPDRKGL